MRPNVESSLLQGRFDYEDVTDRTVLILGIQQGKSEIVKKLLDLGVDVDSVHLIKVQVDGQKTVVERTPLQIALEAKQPEIAEMIRNSIEKTIKVKKIK